MVKARLSYYPGGKPGPPPALRGYEKILKTSLGQNLQSTIYNLQSKKPRHLPVVILGLAIVGYVVAISFLHAVRIAHFMNGFDLAFYQQAIWNTGQGRFLEVSATDFSRSLMGTDVILIYAFMAPFYLISPSVMTLLVVETIIVACGALPVYWLARDRLTNPWAGLVFGLVYLLLPAVQNGNLYELRERPMAGAFLLFAFYFWQKGQFGRFGLAAGLALCCRPENGLVLVMLGLYGWLEGKPKQAGFGWRYVLGPVLLGLGWFGAALVVIQVATSGSGFALGSTFAGGSPLSAVTTLFTDPARGWTQLFPTGAVTLGKLLYIPLLLLPFAFLPLFSPRPLLMALPPVGLNLLAAENRALQWNPFDYHYQSSVIPWLLVAAIFTIARISEKSAGLSPAVSAAHNGKKELFSPEVVSQAGFLVSILVLTLALNIGTNLLSGKELTPGLPGVKNGWGPILTRQASARWDEAKILLKAVPDDAPLAITNLWASYVKPRQGLWLLAVRPLYSIRPIQNAQYIFADLRVAEDAQLARQALDSGQWNEIGQRAEYLLLQRK